ncbi:MAG: hypothetical protein KGJ54_04845 [Betaproteobacteria bacterium]|jgi:hypothetical protein|uniref:hypothetical protein n=1 Tax=Thiomonas sp. 13-64-67 TaxID=1970447 RepID=UPI000BD8DFED|nr:hypothetical protein [Thiomonas sp. 13-64-67]MDE2174594.1 hypothetical protein [Betaproteobacteria bacterium]OZB69220.1 MAG: hypothetical protein B7X30_13800 [Thiomonas sp. 13-64-67]
MKIHYVFATAVLFAMAAAAHAETVGQYAHNVKKDAVHVGKKVVQVGSQTGHAVVHAGKVVGSDVANGAKHGYEATKHEVKKLSP